MRLPSPPGRAADGGNVSRDVSFALAGLTALALLLYLLGVSGWWRGLLAIVVYTFVPGAAVLSFLPRIRLIARIGLAAAFSLTILAVFAYALILCRLFYPAIIVWSLFPAAALALALRAPPAGPAEFRRSLRSRIRTGWDLFLGDRASLVVFAVVLVAAGMWFAGADAVNYRKIADYGLVPLLPVSWKLALAITLGAIAYYATSRSPRPWLMAACVGALVAMIYLTPVIVYDVPHYPWNYKHVGVTELVLHFHRKFSFIDIYNRWPSFFGAAGVYTDFGGFKNTLDYVGWAELYFVSIQTVLVGAIALTEDKRIGLAAIAAAGFVLIDWIGQAYFSPQAMAFTLMLAIVLIIFGQLYDGGNKIGRLLERIGGGIVRRKQQWRGRPESTEWPVGVSIAMLLAVELALAMVHQLTPYVMLIQIVLLTLSGFLRPRWLVLASAAVTIAYLVPQFAWVNQNFGVLGSLDPFANAGRERAVEVACNTACQRVNLAITLSTLAGIFGAAIGVLVLGRRRPDARIGLLTLSLVAPFMTLFGQSYGGEAVLRVVMFSAPFSALIIAMALFEFRSRRLRAVAVACTLLTLGAGFLFAYFGLEQDRYLTPEEVRAGQYLYAHAPDDSVAIPLAPNLPGQLAANYWLIYSPYEGIFVDPAIRGKQFTPGMVDELANWAGAQSPNAFVLFSPEMERYTEIDGVMPAGTPEKLRQAMLKSPRWSLWHQDGDVQIFRLVDPRADKDANGVSGTVRAAGPSSATGATGASGATSSTR